jgi:hypothetical protein
MRNSSYGAVDLTGWTEIESGKPYQTGVDMFVYYRDFTAGGPYNIDSSGAFYLFEDFDAATRSLDDIIQLSLDSANAVDASLVTEAKAMLSEINRRSA